MEAINLEDYRALAEGRLGQAALDYYRSGAHDELTLRRNEDAYRDYEVHYRVMVDVGAPDLSTTILGHKVRAPILVAPTAFHGLACPEAELATVRAAGEVGTIMTLSTLSNTAVEDVVAAAACPVFFQLYVYRDRGATRALVERALEAGCQALVLTVDAPRLGTRERDVRNRFQLPENLAIRNMLAAGMARLPSGVEDSGLAAYFASLIDPALTWKDLEWLASIAGVPVIVKGVVRTDDAVRAADHGAAGLVVSNHGGRQLDTAPATIDVLGPIAAAVGDRVEVLMDGGVRRGTDVLKALALGARGVLLGRPVLWGLAANGSRGAAHVLEILARELELAMVLAGAPAVKDITGDLVRRRSGAPAQP